MRQLPLEWLFMLSMRAEDALPLPLIISSQALLVVPPEKFVALPLQVRFAMTMHPALLIYISKC